MRLDGYRARQYAPSAYLASAAGCRDLITRLLPSYNTPNSVPLAIQAWKQDFDIIELPQEETRSKQRVWDVPRVDAALKKLVSTAPDDRSRARLLAATIKESGLWLQAPLIASLGLRMDDNVIRIATGLRLGVPLVSPHDCQHCGNCVDELATHGLSCRRSQGRHSRHAALNDLLHRSLTSAGIPSRLESKGTCSGSANRLDGVTLAS